MEAMLDVHAPHKRLEGAKEFFGHLFIITVGLLIATQIEACVEWRHHAHLAQEAREAFRVEIEQNLKDLQRDEPGVKKWRSDVDDDLATLARIIAHPDDKKARRATLLLSSHAIDMRDTAWRTAQSTGALAYMPYEEAQRYARIYRAQEDLVSFEKQPTEDVARSFGLIRRFNWMGDAEISPEQAALLSEPLGEMQVHLAAGAALLKENIELNQAFLDGREPKGDFSEMLK